MLTLSNYGWALVVKWARLFNTLTTYPPLYDFVPWVHRSHALQWKGVTQKNHKGEELRRRGGEPEARERGL